MATAVETYPSTQTAPALTGIQHLGLTVRDIAVSEAWYTEVLGLVRLFVEPHGTNDGYAVVMTRPGTGLFMGLDHHPGADRSMFSELRTGLDHFAIQVASREDIDEWVTRLDAMGVEHGALCEATEPARRAQVTFRDPDGIPIELFWFGGREAEMDGPPQLPMRAGSRPRTTNEIPHSQLDQQPDDSRYVDAILAEAQTWASVLAGPSTISVEGARALFLDGREFCHVHAQGDLSLHAVLPLPLVAAAERAGWAEPHFLVRAGQAPPTLVMLYAPRDRAEQDVVLGLVRASYEFALDQRPTA
jgi:catechol 2,3-dioxygenase-like lactoylglutathione lyase family enzyme